jgi:hypothetical protein
MKFFNGEHCNVNKTSFCLQFQVNNSVSISRINDFLGVDFRILTRLGFGPILSRDAGRIGTRSGGGGRRSHTAGAEGR